jgi:hypothetical protein
MELTLQFLRSQGLGPNVNVFPESTETSQVAYLNLWRDDMVISLADAKV